MDNGFRVPTYGPGQSPALMQDPMAAMLVMLGMPMLQQGLGTDKFLPHLTPNQALTDQYLASRYQRDTFSVMNAANERGNAAVAARLLGLRAQVTDAPATQLNREQASNMAGMINNPIVKTMLGSLVGPDNLEALMFGRRGDPTALATAATRVGFFRKDALGEGKRMSGDQVSAFAENMYENLYGKGADIDSLHGFMAGQSGQLMQDMMQRGQLAKSLGALNPADRVRAISTGQRDDATMTRLAEQFGRQELAKDEKYSKGTAEEQRKMLEARMPEFKTRMENTFTEIDKFRAADPRAKSAADIEQMEGYGIAARNVDTQKISKALKERLGAVDAVREIFGDQGVDAPFQALVEALDSLSGGAVDRVDSGKVEKTLREMRLGIRDAGLSLEAVGRIGARGEAMAQIYGTPDQLKLDANRQTIQMLAAMRDTGAYDKKIFGQMTPAEAEQEVQSRVMRGQASEGALSLAALNRAYQAQPELYKGTELEAAMKAANDPAAGGVYEYGGQKKNIFEDLVQNRRFAGAALMQRSGSNAQVFDAFLYDPDTRENLLTEPVLRMQRMDATKELSQRMLQGEVVSRMLKPEAAALKPASKTTAQFEQERANLGRMVSFDLSQVILDETQQMTKEERGAHLEKRHKDIIQDRLVSMGYGKDEAVRMAANLSVAAFGDSQGRRQETFDAIAARANTFVQGRTGRNLAAFGQIGKDAVQTSVAKGAEFKAAAAKEAELSKGRESSFLQRVGEVLEKSVDNPSYSRQQKIEDLLNIVSTSGFEVTKENRAQLEKRAAAVVDQTADPATDKERQARDLYQDAWFSAAPKDATQAEKAEAAAVAKMTPAQRKTHEMIKQRNARKAPSTSQKATDAEQLRSVGAITTDSAETTPFSQQFNTMIAAAGVPASAGAAIGSVFGPSGTVSGAAIGGLAGLVGGAMARDAAHPQASAAAVQQTVAGPAAAANTQQTTAAAGGKNEITINGTLAVRGMQEAVLSAIGDRPMDTPDGGAPVFPATMECG